MVKFFKNQKGVTMMEVLVTVAILAIVVAPCLSAFVMAQRGNVKAAETAQVYTAAANLMEELKGGIVEIPNEKLISREILETGTFITAFCQENTDYYIVTIYTGEHTEEPSDVEPVLKGVIARD